MATASPDEPKPLPDEPQRDASTVAACCAVVLGAVLSLAALGIYDGRTALSVLVGAVIAISNLLVLRSIIRAILVPPDDADLGPGATSSRDAGDRADADASRDRASSDRADAEADASSDHAAARRPAGNHDDHRDRGKRGGAAWGIFAVVKILALFGGTWMLLARGIIDPIPLVVGYGVLPLGIVSSSIVMTLLPPRPSRSPGRFARRPRK